MTYRAIIFDLDGTLLDSLSGIAEATNQLLMELGYPVHPVDNYRFFVGKGIEELFINTIPKDKMPNHSMETLINDYREIYNRVWPRTTRPYEGITELLDALVEKEIPMSILSNKSQSFTERMVEELLPGYPFFRVWGHRPGVPLKPNSKAARQIAKELGVPARDFLFVGDTGIDMKTGRRAGMSTVGVMWGFRDFEELYKSGADAVTSSPDTILKIIETC
jgi:phosphoglycolate phosphatase